MKHLCFGNKSVKKKKNGMGSPDWNVSMGQRPPLKTPVGVPPQT